jgi:putative NIF3 family GTP cyclohydrolase 1 type 2
LALPGDFVGVQVGSCEEAAQERIRIRKCAVTVDADPHVILKAAESGVNVIVAYHGLLPNPVESFTDALLDKIRLLIENRIVLYVVHTSWLSAECGINDTLADMLGLVVAEVFNVELEGRSVPLGRVCNLGQSAADKVGQETERFKLSDFIARISEKLSLTDTTYVGSLNAPVMRTLVLAAELCNSDWLKLAAARSIDTYLSGNISRDTAILSNDLGLNYVCVDSHLVESLGMRRLMQLLIIDIPEVDFIFVESQHPWKRYLSPKSLSRRKDETVSGT